MDPGTGPLHSHGPDPSDAPEGVGRPEGAAFLPFAHHVGCEPRPDPWNGGQVLCRGLVEVHRAAQEDEFEPRQRARAPWIPAAAYPVLGRTPAPLRLASARSTGRNAPQRRRRHAGEKKSCKGEAAGHALGPSKPCAIRPREWESHPKHASFHAPER